MQVPTLTAVSGSHSLPRLAGGELDTVLLWYRRDLRIADNPALTAALNAAKTVVPVFVFAPEEEGQFQPGRCSRWWLHNSLQALEKDLAALGSRLTFRRSPESRLALVQLVQETGAQGLFFNHLYDPISLVRDNEVKAAMAGMGVLCQSFNADVLYEPWEVLDKDGQPLTSFEDFWNKAMNMTYQPPVPLLVPSSMPAVPPDVVGLDLPNLGLMTPEEELSNQQLDHSWSPGGQGAHQILQRFVLERLEAFGHDRVKTDRTSTSRLSPHIHYGEISIRHVFYVVKQRELDFLEKGNRSTSCRDFLQQMGYREYARYLSFHFPFTHERSLLEHLRACPWKFDQSKFKAWRQGRTGYPLVDAGMRQLWSTGWLHNRIRVVCASFLVKNLLLPWQWGLKHYWDALLDADLECAALGWQYCSGCLADAHPFSYMLNHKTEAQRFDPDGNYVRRWLPALARLPVKWIHRPWEAPESILADAGVELDGNYPNPIISLEKSENLVVHACSVIEQSLAWGHAAPKVPYRPASYAGLSKNAPTPSSGAAATGSQLRRRSAGQEPNRLNSLRPRAPLQPQDDCTPLRPALDESDEEVVSNAPHSGGSAAHTNQDLVSTGHRTDGLDSGVAGGQSGLQPAGGQSGLQPAGGQNGLQPAGGQNGLQPAVGPAAVNTSQEAAEVPSAQAPTLQAADALQQQGEVGPETGSGQVPMGSHPQQTQDTDAAVLPSISHGKATVLHLLEEHPEDEGSAAAAAAAHAAADGRQVPQGGHLQAPQVSSHLEQSAEADSPGSAQPALKRQRTQHC